MVGLVIAGFGFANVLPPALLWQLRGGEKGETHENGFPKKVAERVFQRVTCSGITTARLDLGCCKMLNRPLRLLFLFALSAKLKILTKFNLVDLSNS